LRWLVFDRFEVLQTVRVALRVPTLVAAVVAVAV
jgi:hypothetical protein